MIDDERVIVNRFDFGPGDETGHHVHQLPYVILPLTDGVLRIVHDDGSETTANLTKDVPYSRPAGVSHNVINGSAGPIAFLEIEIKSGGA
ncbi:cupin domain-containing protein [Halovulum sp. GXIMD14793]